MASKGDDAHTRDLTAVTLSHSVDLKAFNFRFGAGNKVHTITGRWLSRKPIEKQGGVKLYGFIGNDEVIRSVTRGRRINEGGNQKVDAGNADGVRFRVRLADRGVLFVRSDGITVTTNDRGKVTLAGIEENTKLIH